MGSWLATFCNSQGPDPHSCSSTLNFFHSLTVPILITVTLNLYTSPVREVPCCYPRQALNQPGIARHAHTAQHQGLREALHVRGHPEGQVLGPSHTRLRLPRQSARLQPRPRTQAHLNQAQRLCHHRAAPVERREVGRPAAQDVGERLAQDPREQGQAALAAPSCCSGCWPGNPPGPTRRTRPRRWPPARYRRSAVASCR